MPIEVCEFAEEDSDPSDDNIESLFEGTLATQRIPTGRHFACRQMVKVERPPLQLG